MHNEQLHDLYTSSNIIRVIKLRKKRRTGHAARIEVDRGFWLTLKENGCLGNPDVRILKKQDGKACTGFIRLRTGERGNEPLGP
jgi:hypothetical protein